MCFKRAVDAVDEDDLAQLCACMCWSMPAAMVKGTSPWPHPCHARLGIGQPILITCYGEALSCDQRTTMLVEAPRCMLCACMRDPTEHLPSNMARTRSI